MKSPIVFLPILICCCFGTISARELPDLESNIDKLFNMRLRELNKQCKLRTNFTIDHGTVSKYLKTLMNYAYPLDTLEIGTPDFIFHYTYNPDSVTSLKELLKRIQNCLDVESRLNSEQLVELMSRVLEIQAKRVILFDPITEKDMRNCDKIMEGKVDACTLDYFNSRSSNLSGTIYRFLTGSMIGDDTCEDVLPRAQCVIKAMSKCHPNAKKLFRILLSPPGIGICPNFPEETEPDSFEDLNDVLDKDTQSSDRLFNLVKSHIESP